MSVGVYNDKYRYRSLDDLDGVGDGEKEFYTHDASGYKSRHEYLAVKLPLDKLCERCGRPACFVTKQSWPYDWSKPHHLLCLRCRDDWMDYNDDGGLTLRNWEERFGRFLKTTPTPVGTKG